MTIRFWGVRGSVPTPLTPFQIQRKISAVVQQIQPHHLENQETREAFLASISPFLIGTVGGNTTCVEIRLEDDTLIIIDAGSGIHRLGQYLSQRKEHISEYHIFFTHFHWDHIQGLPFFIPLYDSNCTIHFYSPVVDIENILREQMKIPFFPVTMDVMSVKLNFHTITDIDGDMRIGTGRIYLRRMKHPGDCYSYKIVENGKSFIFSTDTELVEEDFKKNDRNRMYYEKSEYLVMDGQYTLDEALEKHEWGHSSYSLAVDFAAAWDIPNLVLFHHEPAYDDNKMKSILQSARWYRRHLKGKNLEIQLAMEGMELII